MSSLFYLKIDFHQLSVNPLFLGNFPLDFTSLTNRSISCRPLIPFLIYYFFIRFLVTPKQDKEEEKMDLRLDDLFPGSLGGRDGCCFPFEYRIPMDKVVVVTKGRYFNWKMYLIFLILVLVISPVFAGCFFFLFAIVELVSVGAVFGGLFFAASVIILPCLFASHTGTYLIDVNGNAYRFTEGPTSTPRYVNLPPPGYPNVSNEIHRL